MARKEPGATGGSAETGEAKAHQGTRWLLAAQTQPIPSSALAASPAIQGALREVREQKQRVLSLPEMPGTGEGKATGFDEETEGEVNLDIGLALN